MKCVCACFFALLFSPHIECLSALIAGGKADIKMGLLKVSRSHLSPLPWSPIACQLRVPSAACQGGADPGHFPTICVSRRGSDQPGWRVGAPMRTRLCGLLRIFGVCWVSGRHLMLEKKKHGEQGVECGSARKPRALKVHSESPGLINCAAARPLGLCWEPRGRLEGTV